MSMMTFFRVAIVLSVWILRSHATTPPTGYQQVTNPRILEHPEDQYVAKNEPATLNCKAEGSPPPVITWYRDGEQVSTSTENPMSHRMLLPSGQLFFLRIIHNRNNRPDVGVYHCVATNPETGVSVASRNATLQIAVMRDDFQQEPEDKTVGIGDTAILECLPPRGKPDPRVKWTKDNEQIHPHGRITIQEEGHLMIQDAQPDDSGIYVCTAYNIAKEKESRPARLEVKAKPKFSKSPQDVLVEENEDVEFRCGATGDPTPTIIWKREEGQIPAGRAEFLEDNSLRIERVKVSDEGIYICRAENTVGYVEALARLTVHSHPTFIITPSDKLVGVGRTVSLQCVVTGNPPPAVFWNKETSQILMFPRQDHGRFSVTDEGTMIIEPVRKEDSGEYVCQALSVAGSAFAKAVIKVKDVDSRPPPIIHQGPQNQTLPINSVAMLQCHSSGDPPPAIRWIKNGHPLAEQDARIAILDSGTLQISDLRQSDTGLYTCKAVSETGETSWTAALDVESPSNTRVVFHRTPEPSTFPGPPSKPVISDITETSMKLTWKANPNHGASPISNYVVEYFSHETGQGWVVTSDSIKGQSFVVQDLRPDTSYMFLVRAVNTHGMSLPSQVAGPFRTSGGTRGRPKLQEFDMALVSKKLQGQVVHMKSPEIISSTAVKLNWEIIKSHRFIDGFHIKYRVMPDIYDHINNHGSHNHHHHVDYTIETVDSGTATMYVLRNLRSFTWYEIKVQPFYLTIEGQESNVVRVRTYEDVPSAPPLRMQGVLLNNSTLKLSWEPPPSEHHNGRLRGYKIFIIANETRFNRNITVNATKGVIVVQHLVPGINYRIQIAAYNRMGLGIKSEPYRLGQEPAQGYVEHWVKAPWFIATAIGLIGAALWFCLCIFVIWLCRKKKARKKYKSAVTTVPVHKTDDPSRLGSYFTLNAPNYLQKDIANHVDTLRPDVTNIHNKDDQLKENLYNTPNVQHSQPMKTFYNKNAMASCQPYATTTLLTDNNLRNTNPLVGGAPDSAFRPISTSPYTIQPQGSGGSSDSCLKQQEAESNSDNSRPNTEFLPPYHDVACDPVASEYGDCYTEDEGDMRGPVLFLPPPPEHPPPSDIGTPPDSPTQSRSMNMLYAKPGPRIPYHYATDHGTPVSDHQPLLTHSMMNHSDGEYHHGAYAPPHRVSDARTQSLRNSAGPGANHNPERHSPPQRPPSPSKCRTMSPHAHLEMRAYSPRAMSEPERGPTPPVRAYKLVPLKDHEIARHYSDTEGAPVPPLRMMGNHNPPSPAPDDPMMDRGIQSSLPSLVNESLGARLEDTPNGPGLSLNLGGDPHDYGMGRGSMEVVVPDYEDESDLEVVADSEAGEPDVDPVTGALIASWASITDNSDNNSSNQSSLSSSDGSFFAEADFASAVAKAAELSGLTVVGSTVMDPNAGRERMRVRRPAKHRERAKRPTSPYSTDSNYSTVQVPHRPYPKSERKKQLADHGYRSRGNGQGKPKPSVRTKPPIPMQNDMYHHRPNTSNHSNMSTQDRHPRMARTPPSGSNIDGVLRTNPLTSAFDTTDTPIV